MYVYNTRARALKNHFFRQKPGLAEILALAPEKMRAWRDALMAIFPDVKPGDRITGSHQPGAGTRFLVNGKAKGEIADPEFDRLFFGIWLSDATSEPALRQALLAQTAK